MQVWASPKEVSDRQNVSLLIVKKRALKLGNLSLYIKYQDCVSVSGQNSVDWALGKEQKESLLLSSSAGRVGVPSARGNTLGAEEAAEFLPLLPFHTTSPLCARGARLCHPVCALSLRLAQPDSSHPACLRALVLPLGTWFPIKLYIKAVITITKACNCGPNPTFRHTWVKLELNS